MESSIQERENALEKLDREIYKLSKIFRECYLKKGRGALVAHTYLIEEGYQLSLIDFHSKKESMYLFDNEDSRLEIATMVDKYDPISEGILVLITQSNSNATWFVTVRLKSSQKTDIQ